MSTNLHSWHLHGTFSPHSSVWQYYRSRLREDSGGTEKEWYHGRTAAIQVMFRWQLARKMYIALVDATAIFLSSSQRTGGHCSVFGPWLRPRCTSRLDGQSRRHDPTTRQVGSSAVNATHHPSSVTDGHQWRLTLSCPMNDYFSNDYGSNAIISQAENNHSWDYIRLRSLYYY